MMVMVVVVIELIFLLFFNMVSKIGGAWASEVYFLFFYRGFSQLVAVCNFNSILNSLITFFFHFMLCGSISKVPRRLM